MLQMKGGKQVKNSKAVQIDSNALENSTCDMPEENSEMEELEENKNDNDNNNDSYLNESMMTENEIQNEQEYRKKLALKSFSQKLMRAVRR